MARLCITHTVGRIAGAPPRRVALAALIVFAVGVAVLAALIPPRAPLTLDGLSLYGTRARTVPVFLVLLAILAGCCGWLARAVGGRVGGLLLLAGVFIVGVAATPFSVSPTLNAIHVSFGAALFVTQLVIVGLVTWSARAVRRRWWPVLLAVAVGDLLALGALVLDWPTMWVGQVLSQLGFLGVLAVTL
jgi:hypothetical protein